MPVVKGVRTPQVWGRQHQATLHLRRCEQIRALECKDEMSEAFLFTCDRMSPVRIGPKLPKCLRAIAMS